MCVGWWFCSQRALAAAPRAPLTGVEAHGVAPDAAADVRPRAGRATLIVSRGLALRRAGPSSVRGRQRCRGRVGRRRSHVGAGPLLAEQHADPCRSELGRRRLRPARYRLAILAVESALREETLEGGSPGVGDVDHELFRPRAARIDGALGTHDARRHVVGDRVGPRGDPRQERFSVLVLTELTDDRGEAVQAQAPVAAASVDQPVGEEASQRAGRQRDGGLATSGRHARTQRRRGGGGDRLAHRRPDQHRRRMAGGGVGQRPLAGIMNGDNDRGRDGVGGVQHLSRRP